MKVIRLRIEFQDRRQMVLDTSRVFARYNLNITALEVLPNLMYVELQGNEINSHCLVDDLATIPNITKVEEINYGLYPLETDDPFNALTGDSEPLRKAIFQAKLVAKSSSTVLLLGESGTGKELFARAIHQSSQRGDKPFYPVNCAAFPENLLESELFGYEEGTFSGALKGGKAGLFEVAHGSTIFLDEVGDLSLNMQAKLLRVLQEKKIRPIGSFREKEVDVRILAATNQNLKKMVQEQKFREDLYYRLNVIPIEIPSLRQRRADIPLLAEHFLAKLAKATNSPPKTLTARAMAHLISYDWPGNVRELENVVERAVNLTTGLIIDIDALDIDTDKQFNYPTPGETTLKSLLEDYERRVIREALANHQSVRQTARSLGISHTALLKKLKKYNLKKD